MQYKFLILFTLINISKVKSQSLSIDSIIQKVSLQQTILFLSHDSLKGRFTGTRETKMAATFIASKFDSLGLKHIEGNQRSFDTFYNILPRRVSSALG